MKTATVRQLRNEYRSLLNWVEAGEEVAITSRGKVVARLVPNTSKIKKVDWSQSAALKRDRTGLPILTAKQSASLLAENKGRY